MSRAEMNELENQTINEIWMNLENNTIIFELNNGNKLAYQTEGECCSASWFNDLIGVSGLIGQKITLVRDVMSPKESTKQERDDVIEFYGIELYTDLGVSTIIYRNESNGYYGGWCEKIDSVEITENFRRITEDWAA